MRERDLRTMYAMHCVHAQVSYEGDKLGLGCLMWLRAVRPRTTFGPSSDAVVPVPTIGTWVQRRYSREPGGFCWLVGGRGFVEESEKLLGSINGAEEIED